MVFCRDVLKANRNNTMQILTTENITPCIYVLPPIQIRLLLNVFNLLSRHQDRNANYIKRLVESGLRQNDLRNSDCLGYSHEICNIHSFSMCHF